MVWFEVRMNELPPRIGGQRDRGADPARGGSCMKGSFWIWLPPRRFAPPLLFQEGSRNFKLYQYQKKPPLCGSIRMRAYRHLQPPRLPIHSRLHRPRLPPAGYGQLLILTRGINAVIPFNRDVSQATSGAASPLSGDLRGTLSAKPRRCWNGIGAIEKAGGLDAP